MAKHILITEESVSGENVVDKDAEEFSEQVMDPEADADDADTAEDAPAGTDAEAQPAEDQALALAEDIAGRLAAYSGDDLEGYFDELMAQYNADASENEYFPGGYLFTSGQMVDSFEEAVQSLEEGECSGVVESKYGYHIIMKLPVDVDATPIAFSSYVMNGSEYSLRYIVSMAMFSSVTNGWRENMTVELAEVYGEISPSELFDK